MSKHTRRTVLKVSGGLLGGLAAGTTVTAATAPGRFIVDTKDVDTRDLERVGTTVVRDLSAVNLAVVEGEEADIKSVTSKFAADSTLTLSDPDVNEAAPTADEAVDEPYYPLQWDKQVQNVPEVHDVTRGEGTRVAVIDSGVAADHPDLQHAVNTDLSQDFTGDGYDAGGPFGGYHGTHVAGIVAANDQNDTGVVGSAPGTEIVDCRVFSQTEGASFADILAAIVYATDIGCDAANLSLGAYPIPRQSLREFYGKVLNRTMTYANSNGTLLVISAGNDAADLQHDKNFVSLPNEGAQALSVSATGPMGFNWGDEGTRVSPKSPAVYTNYGSNAIDIAAPGGNYDIEAYREANDGDDDNPAWFYDLVLNTISEPTFNEDGTYLGATNSYSWVAGTSMAAPQVAAAAALVKSVNPDYNANDVEAVLKDTATVPEGEDKAYYGAGFLNLLDAVTQ